MPFWRTDGNKWDKALAITLVAGVAMLLLVGLVFAIAYGSQRITSDATSLHHTDEMLRSATVARAQLALGVHAGEVDEQFGTDSSEALSVSLSETSTALRDLQAGLDALEADGVDTTGIGLASREFATLAQEVLAAIDGGEFGLAGSIVNGDFGDAFDNLVSHLVGARDSLAESVTISDRLLSQIGNVARFLVAFLLPAAVIFIYRDLLRRQARQTELETRLETARQIAEAREEFIANASHELRTPLTSITGLAMLLEEMPTIQHDPSSVELLDLMISESVDLNRMVEDLLTTARLDAGALSYSFADVAPGPEIEEVSESLRRSGVLIETACEPAVVRADSVRFRQIVRNLLSNAAKYGGPNIAVHGYVEGRTYVSEIIDDGEGVPTEIAQRLFQRFVHQGQETAGLGSVGLGLSIVQALTQGMGGSVTYRRKQGSTVFAVRLPLSDSAVQATSERKPTPESLTA